MQTDNVKKIEERRGEIKTYGDKKIGNMYGE
jgi:hypothetical protein